MIYVKLTKKSENYKAWIVINGELHGLTKKNEFVQTPFMKDIKIVSFIKTKKWDYEFNSDNIHIIKKELMELYL